MKFLDGVEPINFEEVEHKYTTQKGEGLISVSTLVHEYVPLFDSTGEILIKKAAKDGITPEELKKQWDFERDSACLRGKTVHSEMEYWIDNKKIDKKGEFADVIKQIKKIDFRGQIKSETILYSEAMKLAGTVDLIDFYQDFNANILDLKSNKALKKTSFFTRGVGFEMMLYPINHLQSCNFVHYSLQLHIYAILLEEMGYWVNEKTLIYITPKERKIKLHPILPLRKEAISIKHYNWTQFKNKIKLD